MVSSLGYGVIFTNSLLILFHVMLMAEINKIACYF